MVPINMFSLALSNDFQLRSYLWLQRDAVDALALAFVSHVRIDLGGLHILVSEHVLDGVDARTCINLQGAECMTGAVEGDVLGDARCLQPVLQCRSCHFVLEVRGYLQVAESSAYVP